MSDLYATTELTSVSRLVLLGASGSIGRQSIEVVRQHASRVELVAIAVHRSLSCALELAREFKLKAVAVGDETLAYDPLITQFPPSCKLVFGASGVEYLASEEFCQEHQVDCVLNALVGAAGLTASYLVLQQKHLRLALANKESLVVGGDLLMPLADPHRLLPVDSEHSAIYQCFLGEQAQELYRILLTASGGPFFGMSADELKQVDVQKALAHPNWSMGKKISIDSATLMNKGLEAIEAMHLFSVPMDRIEIVVQRESLIHSMVEYCDGSIKAHLGTTDMRIPIQFALSYPDRWESPCKRVDFSELRKLHFGSADQETFDCLKLALQAGREGGTLPCVLNAADELAVQAFLDGRIAFHEISQVIEACMTAQPVERVESLQQLKDCDRLSREYAARFIAKLS